MASRRKGCYCCKPHKSMGNAKPKFRLKASVQRLLARANYRG